MTSGPHCAALAAMCSSTRFSMRSTISSSAMPSSFAHWSTGRSSASTRCSSSFRPDDVPLLGIDAFRHVLRDDVVDQRMAHVGDGLGDVLVAHQVDALVEDHLALVVLDVVELQQVLADVEVARLDLLLRLFQRLVDPRMDDRLAFLQAEPLQHRIQPVGARRCASGRLPATGRISNGPGRPDGPSGRAAGCRCAATRGARSR